MGQLIRADTDSQYSRWPITNIWSWLTVKMKVLVLKCWITWMPFKHMFNWNGTFQHNDGESFDEDSLNMDCYTILTERYLMGRLSHNWKILMSVLTDRLCSWLTVSKSSKTLFCFQFLYCCFLSLTGPCKWRYEQMHWLGQTIAQALLGAIAMSQELHHRSLCFDQLTGHKRNLLRFTDLQLSSTSSEYSGS